mmetsp:Transcript_13084/g.22469  ORF Transcript_13084/g.22469 Transcript_13084/m.22469 type:complete len:283 (-) Transcript_13084:417-1265(-)
MRSACSTWYMSRCVSVAGCYWLWLCSAKVHAHPQAYDLLMAMTTPRRFAPHLRDDALFPQCSLGASLRLCSDGIAVLEECCSHEACLDSSSVFAFCYIRLCRASTHAHVHVHMHLYLHFHGALSCLLSNYLPGRAHQIPASKYSSNPTNCLAKTVLVPDYSPLPLHPILHSQPRLHRHPWQANGPNWPYRPPSRSCVWSVPSSSSVHLHLHRYLYSVHRAILVCLLRKTLVLAPFASLPTWQLDQLHCHCYYCFLSLSPSLCLSPYHSPSLYRSPSDLFDIP